MFRKITTYFGLAVVLAIFVSYFAFASILKRKGDEMQFCKEIKVTILDSLDNRFVSPSEVTGILKSSKLSPIDKNVKMIDIPSLEELLNNRSAIKRSDVAITRDGKLLVSITQRRPILRIESNEGGFYVDDTEFVFPLVNTFTSYVPIVTGNIPVKLGTGHRGKVDKKDREWMNSMLKFANYISHSEFWSAQIQQIYVENNGDIVLFTRASDQTIKFGSLEELDYKFRKLMSFYMDIAPVEGWNKYSEINLIYSDQIVCTLKETKKKKI